jgi:hypothetical protein
VAAALDEDVEGDGPTASNRGHATVDWKFHACDEACFVGGI